MAIVVRAGFSWSGGGSPTGTTFKVDVVNVDTRVDYVDVDALASSIWIVVVSGEWKVALRNAW